MSTIVTRQAQAPAWVKCPSCQALVYGKRLARQLKVCPDCGHHFRLTARERLDQLCDPGSFAELTWTPGPDDPLGFVDAKPYPERLRAARERTGEADAAVAGTASVDGQAVAVVVMDFRFMGGSMGVAVGELVTLAAEAAIARRVPLLLVTASGGARMQEGCLSLMQMARTSQAMARLHEHGLLTVCVVTDPTFGGVTASFVTLADVLVAEPGALLGFAGPQVIRQTVREELPPGFQTAEYLLERGLLDRVEPRATLRPLLARLLRLHRPERPAAPPEPGPGPAALLTASDAPPAGPAWDTVQLARDIGRPTTLEYAAAALDDFQELHGDRAGGEDLAVVGGPALLGDLPVMLIGQQKGHSTPELIERNFGMPQPAGYRKALRLMRLAEKLGMAVVTLVDTPGAYPGVAAEERGQAAAIAAAIMASSRLRVPIVSVVTGEGGSGGALALGVGNRVLMLEHAIYSVISPEGCSVILWDAPAESPRAAAALRLTAADLLRLGVIDGIVPEPEGGAQADPAAAADNLRRALAQALGELLPLTADELVAQRFQRFESFGYRTGRWMS
jgi:acetyl-CoA carboxylase carboxyl transferase subunit beta